MNRAHLIREWMAANPDPQTSTALAKAIGADVEKTQWTVAVMLREGQLIRTRDTRPMLYALGRPPMDKAETLRLAVEGRARRYAGFAERRKAARLAQQAEDAATREQRRKDAEARRREQRRAYEVKRTAARSALRAAARPIRRIKPLVAAKPKAPEVPHWERQSVEEFLANGGRIERLPAGVWSTPLRSVGGAA
jgi:hypothetical protein